MTLARALRALVLAVVFACALPMSGAYACSCAVMPGGDAPLEGTVFYGEIVRRDERGQAAVYVVDVERVYSGSVGTRAEVRTSAHGASCGLELPGSGGALCSTRARRTAGCRRSCAAAPVPPTARPPT